MVLQEGRQVAHLSGLEYTYTPNRAKLEDNVQCIDFVDVI